MVRLQLVYKDNEPNFVQIKSQFHYGSITTETLKNVITIKLSGLNSTMVRLQLSKTNSGFEIIEKRSQFHYGSITT